MNVDLLKPEAKWKQRLRDSRFARFVQRIGKSVLGIGLMATLVVLMVALALHVNAQPLVDGHPTPATNIMTLFAIWLGVVILIGSLITAVCYFSDEAKWMTVVWVIPIVVVISILLVITPLGETYRAP